jgi:hypothetical protein
MKWTDITAGEKNAAEQRLWVAFGDNADKIATRINTNPGFVADIARLMANEGIEPTTSQKLAREIMGKNMFGVEDAQKHFGVIPTKAQLGYLAEIPFSEEVLKACKDTHVLVAVIPLTILEIRGKVEHKLFYSHEDAWYNTQAFASEKAELGWHLIRKTPVENSTSKNWKEQQGVLSKDEETPKASVVVYTIIGHFLATGERLFEKVYVRTSSLDSGGNRVSVGGFDSKGLAVGDWFGDFRDDIIGLSACRKQ